MQRQAFILKLVSEDMFRVSGKLSINLCQITLVTRFLSSTDVLKDVVKTLAAEDADDLIWYAVAFFFLGLFLIRLADYRKKKEQLTLSTGNARKRTIKFPRNTTFVVEEQENNN